jgi:hypothetical protein
MNTTGYEIAGKNLNVVSSAGVTSTVNFKWPVVQVVRFGSVLVARTEPSPGACDNENVHGVNANGVVIWTVARREYVYEDSPYTGVVDDNGMAKLLNWDGLTLVVDPATGKEVSAEYGR